MVTSGGTGAEALKDGSDSIIAENDPLHLPEDEYKFKVVICSVNFGKKTGLMKRIAHERAWLVKIHCTNHCGELAATKEMIDSKFKTMNNTYIIIFSLLKSSGKIKGIIRERKKQGRPKCSTILHLMAVMMANGRDILSETFKLQIFEARSTIRENSKRPDSKTIQENIINNSASNINESFVLDTLGILVDQNVLLNKPTSFRDSYYIVKSNCSDKRNVPIDCDTALKVMHRDAHRDNDKNTNRIYPKNITITQDASTNRKNRITVTQDPPTNTSNGIDKGTDSYFEELL